MTSPSPQTTANGLRLTTDERVFAGRLAEAAFANPFAEARERLDRAIAGLPEHTPPEAALAAVRARVAGVVAKLTRRGAASLTAVPATDRERLRTLLLFDLFHRRLSDFDALIPAQVAAGEAPCAVPFAAAVLAELHAWGFEAADAARDFAFLYQLRRAFYFVHQSLPGRSPCMRRLREQLWQNVFTHDIRWYDRVLRGRMEDFATLLLGETGTGKGTAAAAIGRSGFIPFDARQGRFTESFTAAFVALNLSQFPESLIESELFGHRKGAFTGATSDHDGVFARCSPCGAVFLDEIGDLGLPVQTKLLQVLQERAFSPVGSHDRRRFAGRVIAATHRPLAALRERGAFREDFYYRLCSDEIVVPPLRARLAEDADELALLVRHILTRMLNEAGAHALLPTVCASLKRSPGAGYAWPGNVRELEQAVRRILLRGAYTPAVDARLAGDLPAWLQSAAAGSLSVRDLLAAYCRLLLERHGTYGAAARASGLDWRTLKQHVAGR